MAKKKKNRKNKKKFYNKREFTNIFCGHCQLCLGAPTTCYDEIYKTSPKTFVEEIHPAIIEVKKWKSKQGTGLFFDPAQFRYAVCNFLAPHCGSDELKVNCEYLQGCHKEFIDQTKGDGGAAGLAHRRLTKKQKKQLRKTAKKKQKEKYIVKAYPTAFMSKNEAWKKVVKRMLSDGDNNRKQNKAEAGSV